MSEIETFDKLEQLATQALGRRKLEFYKPYPKQREFHDAEVGAEMPAVGGQFGDQLLADFLRELEHLVEGQFLDVRRVIHHVEVSAHRLVWDHRASLDSSSAKGFNTGSPAAFFSSFWIFNSASASLPRC